MIFKSHAKVNLALDILGREENGYHLVQTVLQKLSLADEICIREESENSVIFEGQEGHLINTKENTVTKAIESLKPSKNYSVTIKKNIPLGAGLGGGSSNAATVLKAINQMEELGFSNEKLRAIGSKIGVDVPFFIEAGTAFGTHYGEEITILPNLEWQEIKKILIVPHIRKRTSSMYNQLNLNVCGTNKNKTGKMIEALKNNDAKTALNLMHNDFETVAHQGFDEIKDALKNNGAIHTILCGSGTAVLGLSNNSFDLKALSQALPNQRILSLLQ